MPATSLGLSWSRTIEWYICSRSITDGLCARRSAVGCGCIAASIPHDSHRPKEVAAWKTWGASVGVGVLAGASGAHACRSRLISLPNVRRDVQRHT